MDQITDFSAVLYHFDRWDGVAFYTSADNQNWTKVKHMSTPGVYTGSKWYRKKYFPLTLLPEDTNYLKIELSGDDSWEKQVAQIDIKHKS